MRAVGELFLEFLAAPEIDTILAGNTASIKYSPANFSSGEVL
jgi:hypothetical protein